MKSRYKLISLVLAFLLLFTSGVFTQTASAVDLTVGEGTGAPDQTVEIPVTVSDNTGIGGAAFTVKFDPNVLTFNGVFPTDFFPGVSATILNPPAEFNGDTTRYQLNEYTVEGFNYVAVAGARIEGGISVVDGTTISGDPGPGNILFNLSFNINAGVAEGVYPLQLMQTTINNVDAGYSEAGETIPFLTGALPQSDPNFNVPTLAFYTIANVIPIDGSVTVSNFIDEDGDGLDDNWEIQFFGSITVSDGSGDSNGDGLTDKQKYDLGLDPTVSDTDGDGLPDAWEVQYSASCSIDPLANDAAADPDEDGLTNAEELAGGTNPCVFNAPPMQVAGAWLLNFATIKTTSTETVASTQQVSFDVVADTADPNKFSGSFIIDANNYTLTGVKNDDDSMAYFTLNIPGVGAAKGRGKGYMDTATGINKLEGDFAYSTASVSLEGTFEAYINLPQMTGPDPHIVNLNQIYEKFACTNTANDGYGSSNTNYTMTLSATDNTFTGAATDGTAMTGSTTDPQISFTIGSKSFAGVILETEVSGVFSDLESATACKTLGSFTASVNPEPLNQVALYSPAPDLLTGTVFTLPIIIDTGAAQLAAYDLQLTYNQGLFNVSTVTGGTTSGFTQIGGALNINNAAGETTFNSWSTSANPTGVSHIANISAKAVGNPGDIGVVNLIKNSVQDPNFNEIDVSALGADLSIDTVKVFVGEASGYYQIGTGETLTIPIYVSGAGDRVLAAYDFTLYYDPGIVIVTDIQGGTAEFSSTPTFNLDNAGAGVVYFNAAQTNPDSPAGVAHLASITFQILDNAPDQSETYLTLTVNDLFDKDMNSLMTDVFNNVVRVSAGMCGDVNNNKGIDIGDALAIAQNLAKLSIRPFNDPSKWRLANPNGLLNPTASNTRIDIGDALLIAQFRAKLRTYDDFKCGPVTKVPYNTMGWPINSDWPIP